MLRVIRTDFHTTPALNVGPRPFLFSSPPHTHFYQVPCPLMFQSTVHSFFATEFARGRQLNSLLGKRISQSCRKLLLSGGSLACRFWGRQENSKEYRPTL